MPNTTEVLYIFRHNFYKLAVKVMGRGKNVMLKQPSPQKKKKNRFLFCSLFWILSRSSCIHVPEPGPIMPQSLKARVT